MMLSPHPMDHAQKRALQGTNEITGLGLRLLRLPSYTPACFWPDAPRPSSCTPLKTQSARISSLRRVVFEVSASCSKRAISRGDTPRSLRRSAAESLRSQALWRRFTSHRFFLRAPYLQIVQNVDTPVRRVVLHKVCRA